MGARPIASLNALRFGSPDHEKTRHLLAGVVAGIGGYGNCIGVPTLGGETGFHAAYNGNILVNAMTVGIAETDRIFYSAAAGPGNPVVYIGSKTGRDGIHGATMASAEFNEDAETKRPTVQVGDPFTEKLLLEACLELMETDAIIAIQDMGAAGLTSSAVEMASKGDVGIELWLDRVPTRETNMTPYELMLSESQERMLMVLRPEREADARAVFEKWELDFAVIGEITDSGRLLLKQFDESVADIPLAPLVAQAPRYDRPWQRAAPRPIIATEQVPAPADPLEALKTLMGSAHLCSRRWIWEQYDHMVMADSAQIPGGDAGVVRIDESARGIAITTDCTPRYCQADPVQGGRQAVAEAWRNLTAVGAEPLALTNNLNFGNPERPHIMGQLVECVEGMAEAARVLDFPVVSGNVSLYNETNGEAILPTPVIGGVGLLTNLGEMATLAFKAPGEAIVVVGETTGWLGASLYLQEIEDREEGAPPPVDLAAERRNGDLIRRLISARLVTACHDVSDGGLLVAIAEMALAGDVGATLETPADEIAPHAWLFGEDQGRYVVTTSEEQAVLKAAADAGVPAQTIGRTDGWSLTVGRGCSISITELRAAHETWMPGYMAAP
jgi:phosphoribosylformylglycinamidine synthase